MKVQGQVINALSALWQQTADESFDGEIALQNVTFLAESHIITSWECDILVHNSIFGSEKIAYLRPFWGHFNAQT